MGKIFISHSSANNAEALAIHDWLAEQGWGDVFLDLDPRRGLVAGDRWQAALKAAAEQCELILILIVAVSLVPIAIELLRARRTGGAPAA